MSLFRKVGRVGAAACAAALAVTVFTAVPASAAKECHYAAATGKYSCSGSGSVRGPRDVIGARLFTGGDFTGDSLTVWMPRPCKKDNKYDAYFTLGSDFSKKISSVQGWANCWVWLHFSDGNREGPYKDNSPDVGTFANDRATGVGIS
jgi:hypothetical protein